MTRLIPSHVSAWINTGHRTSGNSGHSVQVRKTKKERIEKNRRGGDEVVLHLHTLSIMCGSICM